MPKKPIKVIRTDKQYKKILKEVEKLMDLEPLETPVFEKPSSTRLLLLVSMVEEYEKKKFPL